MHGQTQFVRHVRDGQAPFALKEPDREPSWARSTYDSMGSAK